MCTKIKGRKSNLTAVSHCESPDSLCTSFATSRGSLKEELLQAMEEAYWGDENMALLRVLRSCLKGSHRKQGKNKKSLVIRIIDASNRNMLNIQNIFVLLFWKINLKYYLKNYGSTTWKWQEYHFFISQLTINMNKVFVLAFQKEPHFRIIRCPRGWVKF